MQKPALKLKEIVYEITDNCHQNCSYCGSKDHINKVKIDYTSIFGIIDNIAAYPPEEINVSGGNPLLVNYNAHEYLVRKLKAKDVQCKLIVNPFNFNESDCGNHLDDICKLYDWIGLSVNNLYELSGADLLPPSIKGKYTIITNFNTDNIFNFGFIERYVIEHNLTWQIQYTMYPKNKDDKAIYRNVDAEKYLRKMIAESKARIVIADNMNPVSKCTAGTSSLGILADGSVVPCLSMVSWKDNLHIIDNLERTSLRDMWQKLFVDYRFREFESCKEHCGLCKETQKPVVTTTHTIHNDTWVTINKKNFDDLRVVAYGVQTGQSRDTPAYNFEGSSVFVYGVVR